MPLEPFGPRIAKKRCLGLQNGPGSWGPEKLWKLPNWKTTVLSQVGKWEATNVHLDQYIKQINDTPGGVVWDDQRDEDIREGELLQMER